MKRSRQNSSFLVFVVFLSVALSHLATIKLFEKTVVSGRVCALFYLVVTIPIALIVIINLNRKNKSLSVFKYLGVTYLVSITLLGGFISLLFFAPNYYLADKNNPTIIRTNIVDVGYSKKKKFTEYSYVVIQLSDIEKKIKFEKELFEELKRAKFSDVEVAEGFWGVKIMRKIVIYDYNGKTIASIEL